MGHVVIRGGLCDALNPRSVGPSPAGAVHRIQDPGCGQQRLRSLARGNTIEGSLRQKRPLPGSATNCRRFATERPSFATDDLPAALERSKVTVRATPAAQEGELLLNLPLSVAPIALLVLFYLWLLRRQSGLLGMGGGKNFEPVNPAKSASPSTTWPASMKSKQRFPR